MDKLTRLKQAVHNVLGNHGQIQCKVKILPDKPIVYECTWQRLYEDAGLSDRRCCEGETLEIIFRKIIEYVARADLRDAEELAEKLDAEETEKSCIPPEEVMSEASASVCSSLPAWQSSDSTER